MNVAASSCVHHWLVESEFDRHSLGWRGTCKKCGMERIFPFKDYCDPREFCHGNLDGYFPRRSERWNG